MMNFIYSEDLDLNVAYIQLGSSTPTPPVAKTLEVRGCNIDYDADGNIIGIELLSIPNTKYGCGCMKCDQVWRDQFPLGDTRRWSSHMIVCPECGNKRCPKATHHDNACTRSNEVGQEGSAYQHVDTSWMDGLTKEEVSAEFIRRIAEASDNG